MIIAKRILRLSLSSQHLVEVNWKSFHQLSFFICIIYLLFIYLKTSEAMASSHGSRDFLSLNLVPEALLRSTKALRAQMFLFMQMRLWQFYRDNEICRGLQWFIDTTSDSLYAKSQRILRLQLSLKNVSLPVGNTKFSVTEKTQIFFKEFLNVEF